MPFANKRERDIHFIKHGHKVSALDAVEYERMADLFIYGAMATDARECIRPNKIDRVRFGFITHLLGVACISPDFVRTFHPIRPTRIARYGGESGYFSFECSRINL